MADDTSLKRKLLEKQMVQNRFVSYEVHMGHFLQCQRYCRFLKLFNPVCIQISKFFTGLTDRLLNPLRACARGEMKRNNMNLTCADHLPLIVWPARLSHSPDLFCSAALIASSFSHNQY